jgi:hypothetical protein
MTVFLIYFYFILNFININKRTITIYFIKLNIINIFIENEYKYQKNYHINYYFNY